MSTHKQLFLQYLAQTSPAPLMMEIRRAEGIYLYDDQGNAIIDLISGIGVSTLGHNHPEIQQAVIDQVRNHMHVMVYGELIQSPQVQLARQLMSTLPETLNNVYFVNSGSEATEGAIKLARRHTGRHEIVSCQNAYHGATLGALSVGGAEWMKSAFRPLLPGTLNMEYGKEAHLEMITENTAAVMVETVQGEAGVVTADSEYFKALRKRCDETGALLILDEIQCGFGRTGTFWAFEQHNIVPDVLLTAKAMGGGMPLGAFIANKNIMASLMENPVLGHITTFGGHPVACAASKATIEILLRDKLIETVQKKADHLSNSISSLPHVNNIRHAGLMMAVQFESFEMLQRIIKKALQIGLLTDWFLYCNDSMRIAPPLTTTETEMGIITEKLAEVLKSI